MIVFLLKRLAFIAVGCFGIIFFAFFGMSLAANSTASTPSYNLIRPARAALDRSLAYARGLPRGDWGTLTLRRGRSARQVSVRELIADAYPKSMALLVLALLTAGLLGIPLGVFSALHRHSPLSLVTVTATLVGISLPSFSLAALFQVAEITWYRRFGFALVPVGGFGWDLHLVIPTLVLAARPLAQLTRLTYLTFSEIFEQEYIRTAHAKGLVSAFITRRHAYPNAAVPLLTGLGVSLRFALGSLPVVEAFVGWPGLGTALLSAIGNRQPEGVAGMALVLGLTIMLLNLALDLLYRRLDPRLGATRWHATGHAEGAAA